MAEAERTPGVRVAGRFEVSGDRRALALIGRGVGRTVDPAGDPAPHPGGEQLVLRRRESDPDRPEDHRLAVAMSAEGTFRVPIDPPGPGPLTPGTWDLFFADFLADADGSELIRVADESGAAVGSTHQYPLVTAEHQDLRPYITVHGNLSLIARAAQAHAEIGQVWARDARIEISGRLWRAGSAAHHQAGHAAGHPASLILRDREAGTRIQMPAEVGGTAEFSPDFSTVVDLGTLATELAARPATEDSPPGRVLDLFLNVDGEEGEMPVGSHLDDIRDKQRVVVFPGQRVGDPGGAGHGEWRITPYYTKANRLALRAALSTPPPTPPAGTKR